MKYKALKSNAHLVILPIILLFLIGCMPMDTLTATGTTIPSQANVAIIPFEGTKQEAYAKVGAFILQQGYSIIYSSPDFFTLQTDYKDAINREGLLTVGVKAKLTVTVIESTGKVTIEIRGKSKPINDLSGTLESEICFCGQERSPMRLGWDELYRVTRGLTSSPKFVLR